MRHRVPVCDKLPNCTKTHFFIKMNRSGIFSFWIDKDIIDLWGLRQSIKSPQKLHTAIQQCFERRKTAFDLTQIKRTLANFEFQSFYQQQIIKRFKTLKLPSFEIMAQDILEFSSQA